MSVRQLDQDRKYDLLESDKTNKWHFNHIPYTIDRTLADMYDERKEGEYVCDNVQGTQCISDNR